MKVLPQQLRLYAVTDRTWLNGRRLADVVAQAIDGRINRLASNWNRKLSNPSMTIHRPWRFARVNTKSYMEVPRTIRH